MFFKSFWNLRAASREILCRFLARIATDCGKGHRRGCPDDKVRLGHDVVAKSEKRGKKGGLRPHFPPLMPRQSRGETAGALMIEWGKDRRSSPEPCPTVNRSLSSQDRAKQSLLLGRREEGREIPQDEKLINGDGRKSRGAR